MPLSAPYLLSLSLFSIYFPPLFEELLEELLDELLDEDPLDEDLEELFIDDRDEPLDELLADDRLEDPPLDILDRDELFLEDLALFCLLEELFLLLTP